MVLLNMIAKLTLAVKPQTTLRTLKRVAHAPEYAFLKYCFIMVVNVESLTNCLTLGFQYTCALPYVSEKLSSLAMKMHIQEHCM